MDTDLNLEVSISILIFLIIQHLQKWNYFLPLVSVTIKLIASNTIITTTLYNHLFQKKLNGTNRNSKFKKTISFTKFCIIFGIFQFVGGVVGLTILIKGNLEETIIKICFHLAGKSRYDIIYQNFNIIFFMMCFLLAFILTDQDAKSYAVRKLTNMKNNIFYKDQRTKLFTRVQNQENRAVQYRNNDNNDISIISIEWKVIMNYF